MFAPRRNYVAWRRERAHSIFDDPEMVEDWYERARRGEFGRMGPDKPESPAGESS